MTAPYDARAVANYVLDLGSAQHRVVTQLVLLKVIYFAHGWYLASHNRPLVFQNFEAWKHGPVVKVVRDSFRHFGSDPITERAARFDILNNRREPLLDEIAVDDLRHIEAVYREYAAHSAWELSEMTHESGSPWDRLWNSERGVGRVGMRIDNVEIRDHFLALRNRQRVM